MTLSRGSCVPEESGEPNWRQPLGSERRRFRGSVGVKPMRCGSERWSVSPKRSTSLRPTWRPVSPHDTPVEGVRRRAMRADMRFKRIGKTSRVFDTADMYVSDNEPPPGKLRPFRRFRKARAHIEPGRIGHSRESRFTVLRRGHKEASSRPSALPLPRSEPGPDEPLASPGTNATSPRRLSSTPSSATN